MTAKKTAAKAVAPKKPARKSDPKPAPKGAGKVASKGAGPKLQAKPVTKTAKNATKPAPKAPTKPAVKPTVAAKAASPTPKAPVAKPAAPKPTAAPKPAAAPKPVASKPAPTKAAAGKSAAGKSATGGVVATFVQRNPRPLHPVAEQDDGDENNLLSGPRNVQPYIVKRGEQYMSREQLEHFRTILQSWKQDLMEEVDRTVSHMKDEAANFPDPNDRATQEEEFSLELRTRDRERKLIRKIEEALMRIEDGSYGYCLETGEEIGIKRLEARPVATLSLEAQERRERREKQYGDRDDRYR